MSLISRNVEKGILKTGIFDFEEAGDTLPLHVHEDGECHVTYVARGRFKVFGSWGEREAKAGAYLEWDPGVDHGFTALEPNSRLFNVPY